MPHPSYDLAIIGSGPAGQKAAFRSLDLALPLLEPGQSLRFAVLPEGEDPDDLIRAKGAGAMQAVLAEAQPLSDVLWRRESEGHDLTTPERRAGFEGRIMGFANQIADPNWTLVFTNGTSSLLQASNNNIALITSPITALSWTLQPTNLTVFEGQAANFFSKAVSDSELAVLYQWYTVAPAAPIAGATGPTLVIPTTPFSYNGLQGYVVARNAEGGLSITSSVATLTVLQAVWEPGFAKDERWDGVSRTQVENGTAGTPGYIMSVPAFEVGVDNPSAQVNFARRVSGYFVPPSTGNYVFFVNGDDDTDLFISTDNTPGNKRLVCQETAWSNPWTWVGQGGGGHRFAAGFTSDEPAETVVAQILHAL